MVVVPQPRAPGQQLVVRITSQLEERCQVSPPTGDGEALIGESLSPLLEPRTTNGTPTLGVFQGIGLFLRPKPLSSDTDLRCVSQWRYLFHPHLGIDGSFSCQPEPGRTPTARGKGDLTVAVILHTGPW